MRYLIIFPAFLASTPRSLSTFSIDQSTPERAVIKDILEAADVSAESDYDGSEDGTSSEEEGKPSTSTKTRRGPKEKPLPAAVIEELKSKTIFM